MGEGHYRESISLAAVDVDIIGIGERTNILIESVSKPVLSFRAIKGVVRNLTLRQTGGGCECSIDISAGSLLLENCDISGQSDAVVRIHNAGTRAQLKGNIIHDCTGAGVVVCASAAPLISNNDICAHQLDGLVISTGAAPSVLGNRIYNCKTTGILANSAGLGVIPPSPTLSPTDPVPRGLLTLWAGLHYMCVCVCVYIYIYIYICIYIYRCDRKQRHPRQCHCRHCRLRPRQPQSAQQQGLPLSRSPPSHPPTYPPAPPPPPTHTPATLAYSR